MAEDERYMRHKRHLRMQRNRHTARLAYLERHKLWRMPALTAAWLGACAVEIVAMDATVL
ncbi:hypothetical protein J3E68DRAFT_395089 [Trichoderma sp. SZMC 28012]